MTWLRSRRAIVLGLVPFVLALASRADVSLPEADGPVPVRVTVSVLDLDNVDSVEQSFVANVYYEARWRDARLAHDGPAERAMPLSSVWNPGSSSSTSSAWSRRSRRWSRCRPTVTSVTASASGGPSPSRSTSRTFPSTSRPSCLQDIKLGTRIFTGWHGLREELDADFADFQD